MITDTSGCSTCPVGEERYEFYHSPITCKRKIFSENCQCHEGQKIQYDYRDFSGKLFSCVKSSIEECRIARDKWILSNK